MEEIEELGQRIYSIQQCIAYIANGNYDKELINQMTSRIEQIENLLTEMEEKVDSQLPLLNVIPDLIVDIKKMYEACKQIPEAEEANIQIAHLPLKKQEIIPSEPAPSSTQQPHVSNLPLPQKSKRTSKIPQQTQKPTDVIIRPATEDEVQSAARYINFRIKIDNLNSWIEELNTVINKKYALLKTTNPNKLRQQSRLLFDRYKNEELPDDDRIFFTQEDIKDTSFKPSHRKMLIVLQKIGRITQSTDSGTCRYFIK
ncbi:spindle and kinetochore-associated protein 1 [Histomonas meleagridis]|uniref:spindle and kinetochore-associated protein 1 n=1 Tax=Histomonas meleagridis TaxID=135588 RepID=UPI00355A159F|nr:spindle and kinetochore-associated protein 1 [Histomonas meleagridis]KAH0801246.1 spindle and kinetochore-associated protein 1 [Histomonas meleagridis]